jgi:hypothetical protein
LRRRTRGSSARDLRAARSRPRSTSYNITGAPSDLSSRFVLYIALYPRYSFFSFDMNNTETLRDSKQHTSSS